jgi:hypothetical protein
MRKSKRTIEAIMKTKMMKTNMTKPKVMIQINCK